MKFPINVRVYLKSGEYLGEGKVIKGNDIGYTYNILHNISGYLQGHMENEEETGFKYGCGIGSDADRRIDDFSTEKWLKYINDQYLRKYTFEIKNNYLKNNCSFEEIEL